MDTLAHSFTGWTIARAFPERWGKWRAPVGIISANLPDLEMLIVHADDKPFYLLHHRGWSHCLLGIAVEVVLFCGLVMAAAVWLRRKGRLKHPPDGPRVLLVASLAALSHLLLDWFNTYGVRPLYPFDTTWHYGDLSFIMDPWMWLILGGMLFLGTRFRAPFSGRRASAAAVLAWLLMAVIPAGIIGSAAAGGLTPWPVFAVWVTAAALLAGGRVWAHARLSRNHASAATEIPPTKAARAGLALFALYVACLWLMSRASDQLGRDAFSQDGGLSSDVVKSSANPIPGVPWRYDVLVQTPTSIFHYRVNALTQAVGFVDVRPTNLNLPQLDNIDHTAAWRAWKSFARHPVARRRGDELILGDARYQYLSGRGDWTEQSVRVPAD